MIFYCTLQIKLTISSKRLEGDLNPSAHLPVYRNRRFKPRAIKADS